MKIEGRFIRKSFATCLLTLIFLMSFPAVFYGASPTVMVDFDMAGRPASEVNETGYTSWPVESGPSTSRTIRGVTFTLTHRGGTRITSNWYKAGIQTPYFARLVCDGISVADGTSGAELQMTISGLTAGNHTLLLYHNNVDNPASNTFSPIDIYVNGSLSVNNLRPSARATSTEAAATSFLNFSVSGGQNVVIRVMADSASSASNKNVIINGFELNVANPDLQASAPNPDSYDEHVNADSGSVSLQWDAAGSAVSHDVYVGTNEIEVGNASRTSAVFRGNQRNTSYLLTNIIRIATYYWRVDEVTANGETTKGTVWMFRPRQLAFPEAQGYGRFARGGRGGVVVHVTNLNDGGSGSLRAAVENDDLGPRTIVFDVAGLIRLNSRLVINDKYVTVAGQTAPGKGICIRSAPFGMSGAQDIVIQNVRVRLGGGTTFDGMGMAGSDHSIIDHCSISWTIDEAFSSRNAKNITLQRTLISEALNIAGHANYPAGTAHGYAATISGETGSFHHNLLAHCYGRNWSLGGGLDGDGNYAGRLDIFNNVVYNWGTRTTDGGAHEVNFVNNYYKPGAASSYFYALNAQYEGFPGTQQYYVTGNVMPGHFAENNINRSRTYSGNPGGYNPWVGRAFFPSYAAVQSAQDAYKSVLSDVGCTQPVLDNHDKRVVKETRDGSYAYRGSSSRLPGLPDNERDVGGYENYPAEYRASNWDTDKDGLPNWWETYYRLNPNSGLGNYTEANSDPDNDGYTYLDDYLQWMAKPHYFVNETETVNVNLNETFMGYKNNPSYSAGNTVNGTVSISSGTARFMPNSCGMASFEIRVSDRDGSSMTKEIVVFVAGNCQADTPPPIIDIPQPPVTTPTTPAVSCSPVPMNANAQLGSITATNITANLFVLIAPLFYFILAWIVRQREKL